MKFPLPTGRALPSQLRSRKGESTASGAPLLVAAAPTIPPIPLPLLWLGLCVKAERGVVGLGQVKWNMVKFDVGEFRADEFSADEFLRGRI